MCRETRGLCQDVSETYVHEICMILRKYLLALNFEQYRKRRKDAVKPCLVPIYMRVTNATINFRYTSALSSSK